MGEASALEVLQEPTGRKACWELSFSAPRLSPETPGSRRGPFGIPTLGLGVSHAPHLLAPGPRRPRLLIPDLAPGTSSPYPEGRVPGGAVAPKRAVAGAGSAGLRAAGRGGRGGRGRAGRGAPQPVSSSSPSLETRGRREMLVPPRRPLHASIPLPFMRPSIHSYLSHSFNISASCHPAFRADLLCAGGPCLGGFGESQCRGDPSSTSPRCFT